MSTINVVSMYLDSNDEVYFPISVYDGGLSLSSALSFNPAKPGVRSLDNMGFKAAHSDRSWAVRLRSSLYSPQEWTSEKSLEVYNHIENFLKLVYRARKSEDSIYYSIYVQPHHRRGIPLHIIDSIQTPTVRKVRGL